MAFAHKPSSSRTDGGANVIPPSRPFQPVAKTRNRLDKGGMKWKSKS